MEYASVLWSMMCYSNDHARLTGGGIAAGGVAT
jgi:hypothetical protein